MAAIFFGWSKSLAVWYGISISCLLATFPWILNILAKLNFWWIFKIYFFWWIFGEFFFGWSKFLAVRYGISPSCLLATFFWIFNILAKLNFWWIFKVFFLFPWRFSRSGVGDYLWWEHPFISPPCRRRPVNHSAERSKFK